jgi:hypothetical protein
MVNVMQLTRLIRAIAFAAAGQVSSAIEGVKRPHETLSTQQPLSRNGGISSRVVCRRGR